MQLTCSGCSKEVIGYGALITQMVDDDVITDAPHIIVSSGERVFPFHTTCWEGTWREIIRQEKAMVVQVIAGSVEDIKLGLGMLEDEEGGEHGQQAG